MKRILVFGFTDIIGGVETFFMTYYRKFNKEKYKFDFATIFENMAFSEEIEKNGGRIIKLTSFKNNMFKYKKELKKLFTENSYDAIYVNMLSAANLIPIKLAKKYGIKKIIVHSHNSNVPKNIIKLLLHQINKNQINKYANTLIACSKKAGDWMFGKNDYTILNNAIDVEKFSYNIEYSYERPQELKEKRII